MQITEKWAQCKFVWIKLCCGHNWYQNLHFMVAKFCLRESSPRIIFYYPCRLSFHVRRLCFQNPFAYIIFLHNNLKCKIISYPIAFLSLIMHILLFAYFSLSINLLSQWTWLNSLLHLFLIWFKTRYDYLLFDRKIDHTMVLLNSTCYSVIKLEHISK